MPCRIVFHPASVVLESFAKPNIDSKFGVCDEVDIVKIVPRLIHVIGSLTW